MNLTDKMTFAQLINVASYKTSFEGMCFKLHFFSAILSTRLGNFILDHKMPTISSILDKDNILLPEQLYHRPPEFMYKITFRKLFLPVMCV